jgi:hypothetical protein
VKVQTIVGTALVAAVAVDTVVAKSLPPHTAESPCPDRTVTASVSFRDTGSSNSMSTIDQVVSAAQAFESSPFPPIS